MTRLFDRAKTLPKRLVSLAVLAVAVSLVVAQFSKMLSYEIVIDIALSKELACRIDTLKLWVTTLDEKDDNLAYIVFRTQAGDRRYQHVFHLVAGDYTLSLQGDHSGKPTITDYRTMNVSSDASMHIQLP